MYYIDPHLHMVSRTTDDYETLAKMGCVATVSYTHLTLPTIYSV